MVAGITAATTRFKVVLYLVAEVEQGSKEVPSVAWVEDSPMKQASLDEEIKKKTLADQILGKYLDHSFVFTVMSLRYCSCHLRVPKPQCH